MQRPFVIDLKEDLRDAKREIVVTKGDACVPEEARCIVANVH